MKLEWKKMENERSEIKKNESYKTARCFLGNKYGCQMGGQGQGQKADWLLSCKSRDWGKNGPGGLVVEALAQIARDLGLNPVWS